ncbi:glutamine amidotransferase domain protein [Arthrobacter phage Salgado]|uniref:glutamine--fructose-6-phosphate transaminase (isomerizing) n=3 Tax=Laroyevirus TaxID=1982086 RepID=A0A0U4KRA1_9CAUD|nr:glutamine amidotransferase [Arthrobacter phage Laroye]YP_010082609.1 glutamine amidotransferase [Arthrobacter phage LiSara]YP_010082708.1 glutamine amidotransferase [Arthrobacter phage Salgado]ALY09623.1 glutamine amidotransferase domain protein [Arthrobacter phage Laroye]ALY10264.1 glutamine amidotransferase domain protein [Arthrobacter phage Salgado]ASR83679.1 glutamine amidotransferase [Arthrobacter phage LiSara]
MCGIAAISLSPSDRDLHVGEVAASLLRGIESRGRHATGAAWYRHEDDTVAMTKVAATATIFLKHREAILPATTPAMILHTRYATHGNVEDRDNNHPIQHSNILGIHNGVLQNHEEILKGIGATPNTPVDSEAIMALLNGGEKHPAEVLGSLRGDAAVGWIDLREPEVLHLARVSGRPLCIAQTEGGSLLMASTMQTLTDTAKTCKLELVFKEEVPEAKYLRVVAGRIDEYVDIQGVVKAEEGWRKQYAWTSGQGAAKEAPKAAPAAAAPKPGPKAITGALTPAQYAEKLAQRVKV